MQIAHYSLDHAACSYYVSVTHTQIIQTEALSCERVLGNP